MINKDELKKLMKENLSIKLEERTSRSECTYSCRTYLVILFDKEKIDEVEIKYEGD